MSSMNKQAGKMKKVLKMEVIKRNGKKEKVSFDKIIIRIESICEQLGLTRIDPIEIAKHTIGGLYDQITTEELDFYAAQRCAENIIDDPEYSKLAAGLCVSNMHKVTSDDFMEVTDMLFNNVTIHGANASLITEEYYNNVKNNIDIIRKEIDYDRDYLYDFFAIKTLEKSYLFRLKDNTITENQSVQKNSEIITLRKKGKIAERPQHMIMRVAIGIHGSNIDKAINTYHLMSQHYFTHASPTLYNAGTPRPQLSSCFLLYMGDNIEDIFKTLSDAAFISKWAGGIGISVADIRASGTQIAGTNGLSSGLVPLARHVNTLARYINQGGKRNGAVALYVEPWHGDVYDFCALKKNTRSEEMTARDIFLALWIPDLFMRRVDNKEMWSLMCPHECPGLTDAYGEDFDKLYEKYESEGRYIRQVPAQELFMHIMQAQIETGVPYMLYKDSANKKSNQKNLGTIKCSNLCAEIIEYSNKDQHAVCNLASISLPKFVETIDGKKIYNFDKLCEIAEVVTENLDNIIDINYYPVEEAKTSNMQHRPIGIGVQGLADVFCMMDIPYDSEEAEILNKNIFETIYYGAVKASNNLAKLKGPYSTFKGSPFSEGKLQYHMWGLTEKDLLMNFDWETLIEDIKVNGMRNSLLTCVMPTASTSQILNNTECTEPFTTNLYTRTTLAGEYIVMNRHLVEKLISLDLWNDDIKNEFMYDNGSIQNIMQIPKEIRDIYKSGYEMKTKPLLDLAIGRGPFIDQSQSTNIFTLNPSYKFLTSSHFYGWSKQLKTGMYYLRSQPSSLPQKFCLDPLIVEQIEERRARYRAQTNLLEIKISKPDESDTINEDPDQINLDEINKDNKDNLGEIQQVPVYDPCDMCSG